MADKPMSAMDLITSLTLDMYIPIVDPNEPSASARNKRFTVAMLFSRVTTFTGTSYAYGDGGEFGPYLFIFKGASTSTFTLPPGSDDLINMPIYFCNLGTAGSELNIDGDGTDVIQNSDPFNIPNGDKKIYGFKWMGADGWSQM